MNIPTPYKQKTSLLLFSHHSSLTIAFKSPEQVILCKLRTSGLPLHILYFQISLFLLNTFQFICIPHKIWSAELILKITGMALLAQRR